MGVPHTFGMPSMMMRSPALTAVLACLAMVRGPGAQAQSPHPMTVADLPLLKGVSDPQISPDGRSVAYVRTTSDYQADRITLVIVIVDAASGAIRHATSGTAPQWSPDGRSLALRDVAGSHAGIWIYDVGTEQRRFLVPVFSTNAWLGNLAVKNYAWSPDGSAIAYVGTDSVVPPTPHPDGDAPAAADVEVFSRIMYKTRTGFTDNRRTHIARRAPHVRCRSRSCMPRVLTPGQYDEHSLDWSPEGTHIAFVSDRSIDPDNAYTNDLWTVDAETGQVTRLTDTPSRGVWSGTGRLMASSSRIPHGPDTHNTKDSPAEDTHVWAIPATGGAAWQVAPLNWTGAIGSGQLVPGRGERVLHGGGSWTIVGVSRPRRRRAGAASRHVPVSGRSSTRSTMPGAVMAYVQSDLTHPSEVWVSGADGRSARASSRTSRMR